MIVNCLHPITPNLLHTLVNMMHTLCTPKVRVCILYYPGHLFVCKTNRISNQENEYLTLLSANVKFFPVPAICPIGHKMYLWGISLTVRNFIYDACYNASVMLEEGNHYSFLHRSFQEFLFVHYYVRREDAVYRKAAKFLTDESVTRRSYEIRDIFSMFVDADTKKFEKLVILPLLSSIFEVKNDELAYWKFLSALFFQWLFFLPTEKFRKFAEEYEATFTMPDSIHINLPHDMLSALILGKTSDCRISLPSFPDFEERPEFAELEAGNCTGYYTNDPWTFRKFNIQLDLLPLDTSDSFLASRCLVEENGENCFIGKQYKVKFQDIFDNREKYKILYDYWNEDSQRELVHFADVKNYYFGLKAQYSTDDEDSMSW